MLNIFDTSTIYNLCTKSKISNVNARIVFENKVSVSWVGRYLDSILYDMNEWYDDISTLSFWLEDEFRKTEKYEPWIFVEDHCQYRHQSHVPKD